jgi:MoaA/NifB/PqqE/SkfB family radical SAM enzyme
MSKPIDLVIKPTLRCNFHCTFCSSPNSFNEEDVSFDRILQFIKENEIGMIVVNGGDPLMMPVSFYEDLIRVVEEKNDTSYINLASNLLGFKQNPNKWMPIVMHPRIRLITAFQYGEARQIKSGVPYTEEMFVEMHNFYFEKTGQKLDFISVIDEDNELKALDHVLLAKRLGVKCRLNPLFKSGRSGHQYPLHRAMMIYLAIYALNLMDYEKNTKLIFDRINGLNTSCPFNRKCFEGIRCIQPDDTYFCPAFADDRLHFISSQPFVYGMLKDECSTCSLFEICNGCYKRIEDTIKGGLVNSHCNGMKRLEPYILRMQQ